jgi:hypothetical protein
MPMTDLDRKYSRRAIPAEVDPELKTIEDRQEARRTDLR